jgi:hypothetical protein
MYGAVVTSELARPRGDGMAALKQRSPDGKDIKGLSVLLSVVFCNCSFHETEDITER